MTDPLPPDVMLELRVAIIPFMWSTGDEDAVLAAIGPVVAATVAETAAAELDAAALHGRMPLIGVQVLRRRAAVIRAKAARLLTGAHHA